MNVTERTAADEPQALRRRPPGDARLARAFELLADPSISVLSLDVFDTLLWRRVPEPVDAFPIIGGRLAELRELPPHVTPIVFRKLRIEAEARARSRGASVEVTLDEIYRELPAGLVAEMAPEDLVALELEVERDLLVPDLDVMELVRRAREIGKRVIAVSDTYFSEPELRSLLDPHFTLACAIDRVFASNQYRRGKTSGLFETVMTELGCDASAFVHVGDNEHADVESPRKLGIRCVHFERRPKSLERILEREHHYIDVERPWLKGDFGLGASRAKLTYRSEVGELPPELRQAWLYGATALGPALTGFAEWIHTHAGASKVFCLMREGEMLSRLVNAAGAYLESEVTAEPLWLSRQVCARASIFEGTGMELRALLTRRRPPTVRELCTTLRAPLSQSELLTRHADARLNEAALVDEVFGELTTNPELRGPIVSEARLLRERVLQYVRSKVPPGERRLALVDLGWGGTIQKLLQDILYRVDDDIHTRGLYLVTHDLATQRIVEGIDIAGYLANCGTPGPPVRAIMRSPEILEQVCMPDVGSQIDLTADLEPVLSDAIDELLPQSAERGAVQAGIRAFQREWARYGELTPGFARLVDPDARALLLAQVARACAAPTTGEATVFGNWIHDENFGSAGTEPIVGGEHASRAFRHMGPQELFDLPMSELYWPFGLAALEDEHLAAAAEAVTLGQMSPDAFSSVLETGDFEVYYDNGFGFGEEWKLGIESKRNRFGLSYARATVRADEVRGVRIDPVKAPSILRIDWIALSCWVRDEPLPHELVFNTAEAIDRFTIRGAAALGPKLWMVAGDDPQFELDLRSAVSGGVYEAVIECAYAVMPAAPTPADAHEVELERRVAERSRAVKRFVRQLENRTGVPVGGPLRRGWRRLRSRLGG